MAFVLFALNILCMAYLAVLLHELGHFSLAYLLKRPISRVEIGSGRELFSFSWSGINFFFRLWPTGGCVRYVYRSRKKPVNLSILMAGPGANVLTVGALAFFDESSSVLASISLLMAVFNLWPWKSKDVSSDGCQILEEWRKKRSPHLL